MASAGAPRGLLRVVLMVAMGAGAARAQQTTEVASVASGSSARVDSYLSCIAAGHPWLVSACGVRVRACKESAGKGGEHRCSAAS